MRWKAPVCLFGICIAGFAAAAKNTALFYRGSDWCRAGETLYANAWQNPAFRNGLDFTFEELDEPENPDETQKEKKKKLGALPQEIGAYPALALHDGEGRCFALLQGIPFDTPPEALASKVNQALNVYEKAQKLRDSGHPAQFFLTLTQQLPLKRLREKRNFEDVWKHMEKTDPEDTAGWRWRLTFDAYTYANAVQEFANKKEYAQGEAYIQKLAADPRLDRLASEQKQVIALLPFILNRNREGFREKNIAALEAAVKLAPDHVWGLGATGHLCMMDAGPVAIPYGWRPQHCADKTFTWKITVGAKKFFPEPGRYRVVFQREKGASPLVINAVRLANRTVLGEAVKPQRIDAKKREAAFEFTWPAGKPLTSDQPLTLIVTGEAPEGGDSRGAIRVERLLPPPPPKRPAPRDNAPQKTAADHALVRAWTVHAIGSAALKRLDPDFRNRFLSDAGWMETFWCSGPAANPQRSLELLGLIDRHAEKTPAGVWRNLAVAVALNSAGASDYDAVALYNAYVKADARQLLHTDFYTWNTREMRFVANRDTLPPESIPDLLDRHNMQQDRYGGVCWVCRYALHNFFGDSVHGPAYNRPWDHAYVRHQLAREVSGVCGALSYYGSATTKAHGLLSTPGGQPGHCAYMTRAADGRWRLHYDVGAYTSQHYTFWESRFSYLDMIEAAFKDPEKHLRSERLGWQAALKQAAAAPQPAIGPLTLNVYEGDWRKLPAFETLAPVETLTVDDFSLDRAGRRDHVARVWTGSFSIARPATLALALASDDGSLVKINGQTVIDHDGLHGMDEKTATLALSPGRHTLEVRHFNAGGGVGLDFTLKAPHPYTPEIAALHRASREASPGNYGAWLREAQWLADSQKTPLSAWDSWARGVAAGLRDHQEAAWILLNRWHLPRVKAEKGTEGLLRELTQLYRAMPQSDLPSAEPYNFGRILEEHAKLLDNHTPALQTLFRTAVAVNYGTSSYFGAIMTWGGNLFLADPGQTAAMIAAVEEAAQTSGAPAKGNFLAAAIRKASADGNTQAFRQLCDLQDKLSPPENPALPPAFPAPLLSKDGMLQVSSTSHWDRPERYRRLLDASDPGDFAFHTESETAPWAQVALPGMAEISGIYIANRGAYDREVPLAVQVSADGKTWQEIFTSTQPLRDWKIDLAGRGIRAQYIRALRRPEAKKEPFHLRKLQVYGKKLY